MKDLKGTHSWRYAVFTAILAMTLTILHTASVNP